MCPMNLMWLCGITVEIAALSLSLIGHPFLRLKRMDSFHNLTSRDGSIRYDGQFLLTKMHKLLCFQYEAMILGKCNSPIT